MSIKPIFSYPLSIKINLSPPKRSTAKIVIFIATLFHITGYTSEGLNNDTVTMVPFIGIQGEYNLPEDKSYNSKEPETFGYGILFGIQFNQAMSWDLTYNFDTQYSTKDTNVDINAVIWQTGVRYDYYLNNQFSLYGRLAASYWDVEKTFSTTRVKQSNSGLSPTIEMGFGYDPKPNLSLYSGYQLISGIGGDSTGSYDDHSLLIGAKYRFANNNLTAKKTSVKKEENERVEPNIKIVKSRDNFVFLQLDSNNFSSNSAKLSYRSLSKLDELILFLKKYPNSTVRIVGHTDSTGSYSHNMNLSLKRAKSVSYVLLNRGIEKSRIKVIGRGEEQPIASNFTSEGRAQNRRVDIIIPNFNNQQ